MSDPLATDAASDAHSGAEREAKIEHLLLAGLDHYFDGQYDQAINIWTRALFLDRGHARARAYIERARGALAERQRESEELLQRGLAAFDRGASAEARRLLEAAITRGAPRDEALSVLDRIQRLDPARPPHADAAVVAGDAASLPPRGLPATGPSSESSALAVLSPLSAFSGLSPTAVAASSTTGEGAARPARDESPADLLSTPSFISRPPVRPSRWQAVAWLALAVLVVLCAFVAAGVLQVQWVWERPQPPQPLAPTSVMAGEPELPLPRRGERALGRARVLAQTGRLRDALATLDQITMTDEEKPAADRLRADIQHQLMAAGQSAPDATTTAAAPSLPGTSR